MAKAKEALKRSKLDQLAQPTLNEGESYDDLLADRSAYEDFDADAYFNGNGFGFVRLQQLVQEQRDRLLPMHRNGLRLLKLVNTVLDFSRLESGRLRAAYRPTDLADYTARLASTFRSAAERAGLGSGPRGGIRRAGLTQQPCTDEA